MHVKLLGMQRLSFTDKDGKAVNGNYMHTAFADENVVGLRVERFFVKEGVELPECKINDNLDISFNMKGKVESIKKVG